jgi:hypothetical protein
VLLIVVFVFDQVCVISCYPERVRDGDFNWLTRGRERGPTERYNKGF